MGIGKGAVLYNRAKKIIPGGVQLLSKRPEMFLPQYWPAYYAKCKGITVWDLDNKEYLDFSISGVGACTLGYADIDVDSAVKYAIKQGNMCTLNAPEEVELARLLCEIHPWAQMVRYARTGGEAMAVAVRIIRAHTGKEKILFCGYHGWHDWYLSVNLGNSTALDGQLLPGLNPQGVPKALRGTAFPFQYNDLRGFKKLINKFKNQIAGVIMEPIRNFWPEREFIQGIRQITKDKNIPLVFDEITAGFRITSGGSHLKIGIAPDLAVFAKALSNGYPMAAIIGRAKIMESAQKTFISSTYWTDKIGPAAAIATIKKHSKNNVGQYLIKIGSLVQKGWKDLGQKYGLNIQVSGIPPLSRWNIVHKHNASIHALITKNMLKEGFLSSKAFYATYAHNEIHIEKYINSLSTILRELTPHINNNSIKKMYKGPLPHIGFKRIA